MARVCIIPDTAEFRAQWASSLTRVEIAAFYQTSPPVVSAAALRYGLKPRRRFRNAVARKVGAKQTPKPQEKANVGPMFACIERLSRARDGGEIPTPPFWTQDRDEAVLATGGSYAAQCEIAFEFDVDYGAVIARWHLVRKVARI